MKLGDKPILDEVDSISTGSLGLDIALGAWIAQGSGRRNLWS